MPFERIISPSVAEVGSGLGKQIQALDRMLERPHAVAAVSERGLLEAIGRVLWQLSGLSAEEVLDGLEKARDEESPVRLVVSGEATQHLPWELLYHDHPALGFLSRHPWCVLARRIRGSGKRPPRTEARPLRLLLFVASPEDLDPERSRLDFEREEELLFSALDRPLARGHVDIDVAEDGALKTLRTRLEEHRYHAVIFSMHGTEARNRQGKTEWGLLFEDARTGCRAPVAGSDLAEEIQTLPRGHRPGLVVLSACRSAQVEEPTAKAIPSVASALHEGGCERVLGMRQSVLDPAASAFNAEFFRQLALGDDLGRSVGLARAQVAKGEWLGITKDLSAQPSPGDPFAQWTLPVLLDRTAGGPLVDVVAPAQPLPRPPSPSVLIGDGTIQPPGRGTFIGRRAVTRQYLRRFLEGNLPSLLFTGPGGVGKTALAGVFARRLYERYSHTRLMGFRAPFRIDETLFEALRQQAFDGEEEPSLQPAIQAEPNLRERLRRLLLSLAKRPARPCAFVLDNLEVLQDTRTLAFLPEHDDSRWFTETVLALPPPTRVLLTGRYALTDLHVTAQCPLPDAPYGDVLQRMNRLDWPLELGAEKKRWVYQMLGGNHRALEWFGQLITEQVIQAEELLQALKALEVPPETPDAAVQVVLEAMRQNLLLENLRQALTPAQDRLLRAATYYRVPVHNDGLRAIESEPPACEANRERLAGYSLLERGWDPTVELEYFEVPPVVRELLGARGFTAEKLKVLHAAMGCYHRFQGAQVTRRWADDLEAIYHFRCAGEHGAADDLTQDVASHYYGIGNYADAKALTEGIVVRTDPPAPWWALNRYGQCQLVLGAPDPALAAFERALKVCPERKDQGATLNNLSQIYDARGDYDTALKYLEQSLTIQREIGDKAGEGATLNNLSQIYKARGDYDTALKYLEQSLLICRESGNKAGEGATLNNLSQIYKARGDYDTALKYLEQSLLICRESGNKAGEGATLNNLATTAHARGDYDTALKYLEQSLTIQREIGDKAGEGATLNNLSQIYDARGDYDTALKYLEQSLTIRREIGDKAGEGATLNNLSQIYDARGDYDTALKYLEQSLTIRREIGDKAGEGATLNNLSQIYKARGDYDTALKYLEQSLLICRESGNKAGEGATLNNLATTAHARGDYDTALKYLEQSLTIRREIGDKAGLIPTLHNMAHIALAAQDAERALKLWSEALSLAKETGYALGVFHVASALGRLLGRAAPEQARELLSLALQVGRQAGLPDLSALEAALHELGGDA